MVTISLPHVTSDRSTIYHKLLVNTIWQSSFLLKQAGDGCTKDHERKIVGSILHFSFPSSCRWEMPKEVEADKAIFQMGRDYQFPHSYLVFRHFRSNLTGRYKCRLLFREAQVGSHIVHLSLDESTQSSRICPQ